MYKIYLKIYIFFLIFQPYIFQFINKSDTQYSGEYNSNNTYYIIRKNRRAKIFQTLYSDSPSNNYYYTTLYLGKNKSPQVYILDTGSSITTSPCDQCTSCGEHLNPKYPLENTSKILSCE